MGKNRILTVAAHPDDEILGCAGTIARYIKEGYEEFVMILGEGITSRDNWKKSQLDKIKKQIFLANKKVGISKKNIFIYEFPDNQFDIVPFLKIVKIINKVKKKIKPNIVFTHNETDLNIDHQIAYQAVVTATRPLENETVKKIYSFEIPSSTEWNYPHRFQPNVFFDIAETINIKIDAMRYYSNEIKKYPHPRSAKGIKILAQKRGLEVNLKFAEAFNLVREKN